MRTLARYVSVCITGLVLSVSPALAGSADRASQAAQVPALRHVGRGSPGMDRKVKPGDDFDRYVNGGWKTKTEIPADQRSAGVGYDVFNRSQEQIRAIIENAPATTPLGGMYKSFMNEAAVDAKDDKPLQADLNASPRSPTRTRSRSSWARRAARSASRCSAQASRRIRSKPEVNTLFFGQAGLGLARSRLLPHRHVQAAARGVSRLHRAHVHDDRTIRRRRRRPTRCSRSRRRSRRRAGPRRIAATSTRSTTR